MCRVYMKGERIPVFKGTIVVIEKSIAIRKEKKNRRRRRIRRENEIVSICRTINVILIVKGIFLSVYGNR